MADSNSNLPATKPPLDRSAIDRVLARAAELQAAASSHDTSDLLSEAELMEIGKEAGINPATLSQALAEERSRVAIPEQSGFVASITGPGIATASRTVRGKPEEVLAAVDRWMQSDECLRVQRRFPDRITWEAKTGFLGTLQRNLNVSGKAFHLVRASQVAATVIPVDEDRVVVRLDADFSQSRQGRVQVAGGTLFAGILGSGVVAVLGSFLAAPEAALIVGGAAAVPTLAGAGIGYLVGKGHREVIMKAQLALEQTLDRLEFGTTRRLK